MRPRMERDLDRPTPYTLRAFRYGKSAKGAVDPVSCVHALPDQADYPRYVIDGGVRERGAPGSYGNRFAIGLSRKVIGRH